MNCAVLARRHSRRRAAFSIIELLIIMAIIAVLVAVFLPALAKPRARSSRINCANNLKQMGLAFKTWGLDNGDKFPMGVATNMGGSMEWMSESCLAPHFQVMSNELSTPKILVCPNDGRRETASSMAALKDENISYFLNPDVSDDETPQVLLAGDGNLTNATLAGGRILKLAPGVTLGWSQAVHRYQGNLLFTDGHVGQFANGKITSTNAMRLVLPIPPGK